MILYRNHFLYVLLIIICSTPFISFACSTYKSLWFHTEKRRQKTDFQNENSLINGKYDMKRVFEGNNKDPQI